MLRKVGDIDSFLVRLRSRTGRVSEAWKRKGVVLVSLAATTVVFATVLLLYVRITTRSLVPRGDRPISYAPMGSYKRWAATAGHPSCQSVPRYDS